MFDQNLKEEFNQVYRSYIDTKTSIKEMNGGLRDLIKSLSKKMDIKAKVLTKAFAYKFKITETGEDDIFDIQQVIQEIEN